MAKKAGLVRVGARQAAGAIAGSGNNKPAARSVRPPAVAPAVADDSNRLLREAAWSRMFGRIEAKNPFAR